VENRTAEMLDRFRKYFRAASRIEWLKGGELFSFDEFNLKVLHTPGHTAGSISLFDETKGVLLPGDCLIKGFIPYICAELGRSDELPAYYGLHHYERSLDLLGSLPVRLVLPGHGPPFSSCRELIQRIKHNRVRRRKRILELLGSGKRANRMSGMSQFEIAKQLFLGPFPGGTFFMVVSEVRGCLELMEKEGQLAATFQNEKWVYCLNH